MGVRVVLLEPEKPGNIGGDSTFDEKFRSQRSLDHQPENKD